MSILSARSRSSRFLRVLVSASVSIATFAIFTPTAYALPSAPTMYSYTETGNQTISLTVTFTPGASANTIVGYQYSTDGGSTWGECHSGNNCNWVTGSSQVTIQKLSDQNNSMFNGSTYQVVLSACDGGSPTSNKATNANRGTLGLTGCGASSSVVTYKAGTGVIAGPTISTSSAISYGASSPTVVVTSTGFNTSATASDFSFNFGSTGLTGITSVVFTDTTTVTFTLTGTAAVGSISIYALASAYSPAAAAVSNTVTISIAAVAPGPPRTVTGTAASSTQINISWLAPLSTGGASISNYLVSFSTDGTNWTATSSTPASTSLSRNITGLSAATTYYFKVAAVNSAGTGSYSSNSAAITTGSGPAVPETPTAVTGSSATDTSATLNWTAPSVDGGASIDGYWLQKSSDNGATWETITVRNSTSTTYSITGLTASTTYKFRVAARNSIGFGPFSVAPYGTVTTSATPTVPETPTAVSAGSATSSSLTVSWTAPANTGGASIDVYQVERSIDGTTWVTVSSSASSPLSVTGLSASTSYVFRVRAHNSVGWGPYSDSSTVVSTSAASSSPAPEPEKIYPPTIDSLSKLKVCARGHDEFIIRGNNFKNAVVTIDGVVVTIKGKSDGIINLSFGEATEGKKTITITNPAGSVTAEIEFKMVDKTAFKVFDIPYIYKGGSFLYKFEAFGENTFRITGNMPAGLVLNAETGEISGTPTEEGKFNFVLHADGLCGNDVDVIKLDIDREIPNAISHRIKFSNSKSKKITGTPQFELKKFLDHVKKISPKQIEPIIYITGGAPENEADVDSQSAKDRRDSLCDIMLTQEVLGQTMLGLFDGEEDEIEIFVYWPVVR